MNYFIVTLIFFFSQILMSANNCQYDMILAEEGDGGGYKRYENVYNDEMDSYGFQSKEANQFACAGGNLSEVKTEYSSINFYLVNDFNYDGITHLHHTKAFKFFSDTHKNYQRLLTELVKNPKVQVIVGLYPTDNRGGVYVKEYHESYFNQLNQVLIDQNLPQLNDEVEIVYNLTRYSPLLYKDISLIQDYLSKRYELITKYFKNQTNALWNAPQIKENIGNINSERNNFANLIFDITASQYSFINSKHDLEQNPNEDFILSSLRLKEGETAGSFYLGMNNLLQDRRYARTISFLKRLKLIYVNDNNMVGAQALFNKLCDFYINYMSYVGYGLASTEYLPVCYE